MYACFITFHLFFSNSVHYSASVICMYWCIHIYECAINITTWSFLIIVNCIEKSTTLLRISVKEYIAEPLFILKPTLKIFLYVFQLHILHILYWYFIKDRVHSWSNRHLKLQPHEGELAGWIVDELRIGLISGGKRTVSCPFATGGKSHWNRQRLQRRPMAGRAVF